MYNSNFLPNLKVIRL